MADTQPLALSDDEIDLRLSTGQRAGETMNIIEIAFTSYMALIIRRNT